MASRKAWYVFTPFAAWLLTSSCSGEDSRPEAMGGFPGTGPKDASSDASGASDGGESIPCSDHEECPDGMYCVDGRCAPPPSSLDCPSDMVSVANLFCVDRFEASRQDATDKDEGVAAGRAYSRGMVMPWRLFTNEEAANACELAGKRLCTPGEWQLACEGPAGTVYGYGDQYEPETCNGIETFGLHFHLVPTGSLPDCVSGWGAYDLNGNLWEHVLGGDSTTIRGGAYNCSDSRTLHRCDYVPASWSPTARGFRCCLGRDEKLDASCPVRDSGLGGADG